MHVSRSPSSGTHLSGSKSRLRSDWPSTARGRSPAVRTIPVVVRAARHLNPAAATASDDRLPPPFDSAAPRGAPAYIQRFHRRCGGLRDRHRRVTRAECVSSRRRERAYPRQSCQCYSKPTSTAGRFERQRLGVGSRRIAVFRRVAWRAGGGPALLAQQHHTRNDRDRR